jgi:hypothetical protein
VADKVIGGLKTQPAQRSSANAPPVKTRRYNVSPSPSAP